MDPLTVMEPGPSMAARLLGSTIRTTIRPALQLGCRLPWPYELLGHSAGMIPRAGKSVTVQLCHATAQLICAPGVPRTGRAILYCHGGGFIFCGSNTHSGLITRLSRYSNCPVLAVDYRMIPRHSVGDAINDCLDAYMWLRERYDQITLAGDSAGGYLALALATNLQFLETPAALVLISPLLQLDPRPKNAHPNIRCDAMFGPGVFDSLLTLVMRANGGKVYEPLEYLTEDLPPTLIHVSGQEALLYDARLAARRLADLGVPVEVHVWPGQIHVFQIAPMIPESKRSLKQIGSYVKSHSTNRIECNEMSLTDRTATVR